MDLRDLEHLAGAPDENFEVLTRSIVSRRFGGLGTLRERRQQPGVEFYLRVEHPGDLGEPGRVWGWSCKWFILGSSNELTQGQRDQIEDSADKAIKYVDGLSDFVLCVPERPAKKDLDWLDALGPAKGVSIKLWAAENFDAELAGFDELRSTFFGELVLSPDVLAKAHKRSVAPVEARWVPPLHTSNHAERQIERILLRAASFDWLEGRLAAISARIVALHDAIGDIDDDIARSAAAGIAEDLDQFVADVQAIIDAGRNLHPMEVRDRIADQRPPSTSPRQLRGLVLQLRKRRLPAALAVTGLGAEIRDVVGWLHDANTDAQAPLIALVAAAGQGKTHLTAQLTSPTDQPTAGVFIQGGHLRAGGTLDDLARRIPGLKVDRFEDLLEALNSAGARAGARVPLVVDGLNEAERPSEWRTLLDQLIPALCDYPYVLVIVTLREALAASALPGAAKTILLDWSGSEVDDIVHTYFEHYLINPSGAWLPTGMFRNPLFVRMYCEAANPHRQQPVGIEALPTSLVGVFELYRTGVVDRLERDPARVRIPADQIKRRLADLAMAMWTRSVRRLPSDEAKTILDAGETNWDESLFRRLEEEGVLFREEVDGSDDTEVGILFDRFAGYLIADSLLSKMPYADVAEQLGDEQLWNALGGADGHSFGEDVVVSLIGLLPRRFVGHHLWRFAPDAHRSVALAQELDMESEYLDAETVDELAALIVKSAWATPGRRGYAARHPFDRLWEVSASPAHRLNAEFLDRVLRLLSVPERDRMWSEWIRHHADDRVIAHLNGAIQVWTGDLDRFEEDDLAALTICWLLTSTNEDVRDLATKALQRYGRPQPKLLFELGAEMLNVDDPYVVERIVGAAFGAASAHQMPDPGGSFEHALGVWLEELGDRFLENGSSPTEHELLRSYVRSTFELAGTLHPGAVPAGVDPFALTFATPPPALAMADDDPHADECGSTFGMDFENYVIGSAIANRGNYDFDHPDFRRARGEVMARVWDLGWRADRLGDVDRAIAEARDRFHQRGTKAERYGKKYGWIAYYELTGRLADAGQNDDTMIEAGRKVTPDIDPSFPDEPPAVPFALPHWSPTGPTDDEAWLRNGEVNVPAELWSPDELHGVPGGWLLVDGFLQHRRDGRRVFGFFHTLLVNPEDLDSALELVADTKYLGNHLLPALPTIRAVFAGEVPWSRRFDVRFGDDGEYPSTVLRRSQGEDLTVGQLAVELATGEGQGPTVLQRSYDVPSFDFASELDLRQLPGTLDLVGFDGVRASASFRVDEPWQGKLLFIRQDLVNEFAGNRRILQVAWGEREVTVEWRSPPAWVREAHQGYEHVWRHIRVPNEPGSAEPN